MNVIECVHVCLCVHVACSCFPSCVAKQPFLGGKCLDHILRCCFFNVIFAKGIARAAREWCFFKTWIMDGFDIFFQFSYLHDLHGQRYVFTSRGTKFWSNPDC